MKIEIGEYLIDKDIVDVYVKAPANLKGFERVCSAIDIGGGQTCDVNGVLKVLHANGYRIALA